MAEPEEVDVRGERGGGLDRFATPLYTVTEAARYLDVPASTFATWTHGYRRRPAGRREVVGGPFIGLAEGLVLGVTAASKPAPQLVSGQGRRRWRPGREFRMLTKLVLKS